MPFFSSPWQVLFLSVAEILSKMECILSAYFRVLCLIAQSCLTFCNPMDCSPPGSSIHEDSPGKNTGVGCHALLQGIFPTQGSNPGLPRSRQILYHLRHQGSHKTRDSSINPLWAQSYTLTLLLLAMMEVTRIRFTFSPKQPEN